MMSGQPLYLHTGDAQRLDLDAVQRLRIERRQAPERIVPLHLVSRIVCNGNLDISSRALSTCLKRGIPIAIVTSDGQPLGWCLGVRRVESSMQQLLLHALDDPMSAHLYERWLESQALAAATQNLLLCGVPATAQARRRPRATLCNAHFVKHQRRCGELIDAIAHLAQHELAARLLEETGAPDLLAWKRPGVNIILDLGHILGLHAHTDVQHAASVPPQGEATQWAVLHYERHAAHWQQRIGALLFAFEQFLRTHWM